jgi:hypothetical protein
MTLLILGNTAPLDGGSPLTDANGDPVRNTITDFRMREDWRDPEVAELALSTPNDPALNVIGKSLSEDNRVLAIGLLEVTQAWDQSHSADPPEWVASDDEAFAQAVAEWYSTPTRRCLIGRPEGWDISLEQIASLIRMEKQDVIGLAGISYDVPPMGGGSWMPGEFSFEFQQRWREHELLTTAGKDALHLQHLGGSGAGAQPAQFQYMAIANNATATTPAVGDTVLTGEITTAGGGLLRGQATYAHTGGASTTTLTRTFTANGSDSLPVTVSQDGIFNATSAGTMAYKSAITPSTATLSASGDSLTLTRTITAS